MLELCLDREGVDGVGLLRWWQGGGAVRVIAQHGPALLMERACDPNGLAPLSRAGADDIACRILCNVATRLHAPRLHPLPTLVPLQAWFAPCWGWPRKRSSAS